MARWALALSFQKSGSSACLFSSASRACDASTSKMPPQQPDRPLDVLDDFFRFGAHGFVLIDPPHLAIAARKRNIARCAGAALHFACFRQGKWR
jgi:hypothetical protein